MNENTKPNPLKTITLNFTPIFEPDEFITPVEAIHIGFSSPICFKRIKMKKIIKAIDAYFLIHFPHRKFVSDIVYHETIVNGKKDQRELYLSTSDPEITIDDLIALVKGAAKAFFPCLNVDKIIQVVEEIDVNEKRLYNVYLDTNT